MKPPRYPSLPLLALTAAVAVASALPSHADEPAAQKAVRPRVEVVFAIDTTGSMGGLIDGAKKKVWSIVNEIVKGQPTPEVKLGLVAYRDRGDSYITSRVDLTNDLDAVYGKLMGLGAGGGGDGPESVNQALAEAVDLMSWSPDRKSLKIIFLVGDYPPHMDYKDDVKYPETCKKAALKDIVINTIQCGQVQETTSAFKDIARRAEGRFVAIAQSGGTVAVATPYDDRLASLSSKLDSTFVAYGAAPARAEAKASMDRASASAAGAAPEAAAARASYRAKSGAVARGDLIAEVEAGRVELDRAPEYALPDELKGKSKAEREAWVTSKREERDQIRKEIASVSAERDAYVKKELSKKAGSADSFDAQVVEAIRAKAAEKGIVF